MGDPYNDNFQLSNLQPQSSNINAMRFQTLEENLPYISTLE